MAGSRIRLYGSTSGYVELEAPAVADDGVLSLPTAADGFGAAGIGSNVVQTVKTDTYSASVGEGSITSDITGLSAVITPTSATSKVLVIVSMTVGGVGPQAILYRDASPADYRGDADGSRKRIATASSGTNSTGTNFLDTSGTLAFSYVDSPATTSAVTYSIRMGHVGSGTQTIYVNRYFGDSDSARFSRGASGIIAIEVAA